VVCLRAFPYTGSALDGNTRVSIRLKYLLVLLLIALLPVLVSGWQSQRVIEQLADRVAHSARESMEQGTRQYLGEKVADIGSELRLVTLTTDRYLRLQQDIFERALRGQPVGEKRLLYSESVPGLAQAVEDRRFERRSDDGSIDYLKIIPNEPSFLPGPATASSTQLATMRQLQSAVQEMRALYAEASGFSLWHYVGLDNGVTMAFPGHGDYPDGFDPRQRPWYLDALAGDGVTWSPLSLDASTGQPVLTASIALRDPDGAALGVTAIDLPLRQLLDFRSSSAPWLNVSQLALVQPTLKGSFEIVAMQERLQVDSDWRRRQAVVSLEQLTAADRRRIDQLRQGQSALLETVSIRDVDYSMAVTALGPDGRSYLALLSPREALESELARTLAPLERQRQESLRQHLLAALLLAGAVALLAWYLAHRSTAPLIRMSETTAAIADGDLGARTGLRRRDELGRLSVSIDRMADAIEALQADQEKAYRDMILSLTRALEKKDSYTAAHSGRVTRYALRIGRALELDEVTLEKLRFGAMTHDLGKIGIADAVLNKPMPLEGEEKRVMEQHPGFSRTIMKPLMRFREYAEIAGSHHERWDGSGYPEGLAGEQIPLLARIVAIADAWDAMTGDRVYRKGMSVQTAIGILDDEKDSGQFDPELIRVFVRLIREEDGQQPADDV
jgi:HD-GYP domain-containing protein (c-di-GMP phosphodiesterase class II)